MTANAPQHFIDASRMKAPVVYQLPKHERLRRQGIYADYYKEQIANIREYLKLKGFETTDAFLDVLIDRKAKSYNWRKDGYTPEIGHEIDLLLARISAIESGLIDVKAAEAKYGSIESALISTIVHDLGEDCGLMPEDLRDEVLSKLNDKIGGSVSAHHQQLVFHGMQSMERLTHDRHYRVEDFVNKFNDEFKSKYWRDLDIPIPQENAASRETKYLPLDSDIQEFLWEKMDILPDHGNHSFQAFIMLNKKGEPRITVTRYGHKNRWGADWNEYIETAFNDPYDADGKFGDRANGMTSRHAIESFTSSGLNRYMRKSSQSFDLNDANWRMTNRYPELAESFKSLGGMMGIAYTMSRIMINHYPDMNDEGESGFSVPSLPKDADGIIHIDPKDHFENGFGAYMHVPGLSHPIGRFMQQMRDVVTFFEGHPWHAEAEELSDQFRRIILKHGSEPALKRGLDLLQLTDLAEHHDPMPALLEKIRLQTANPSHDYALA